MSGVVKPHERIRAELLARVRARRAELDEAIFVRVCAAAYDPAGSEDAEYVAGLRTAIAVAVEHALAGIERGEAGPGPIPPAAIEQAHRAARVGVSLDTVLRRYVIGSTLLGDFLMQEADHIDVAGRGAVLREVLAAQAEVLDRLLAAITGEYAGELERAGRSPEQRRSERVRRLLAGEAGETAELGAELGYELDAWHVGAIATGAAAGEAVRCAAAALGSRLLCVSRGEDTVWGWLGGGEPLALGELERALAEGPAEASLAVGEPARGLEGWRLTHRQAQAALRVALQRPQRLTRYADVALLASVLRDDALAGSLVEIYLAPLGSNGNGGAALRETLRTYFASERNASSAAAALGVARHTVENRLRTIEERLGQRFRTRQAELEVALRLEELGE